MNPDLYVPNSKIFNHFTKLFLKGDIVSKELKDWLNIKINQTFQIHWDCKNPKMYNLTTECQPQEYWPYVM